MLKKIAVLTLLSLSAVAWADADCPKSPKEQWLPMLVMQKKIVNDYGFAIKRFLIEGHCYEIYGWEVNAKSGKSTPIEVYFNPVTGDIVKKAIKG